jgi:hypothetical protein
MAKCKKCGIQMSNFEFFSYHNECENCAYLDNSASISEKINFRDQQRLIKKYSIPQEIFFIISLFFPIILLLDAITKEMHVHLLFYTVGYPTLLFILFGTGVGLMGLGFVFCFHLICAISHSATRDNY